METAASNPDKCRFGLVGVKRDARGEIEQARPGAGDFRRPIHGIWKSQTNHCTMLRTKASSRLNLLSAIYWRMSRGAKSALYASYKTLFDTIRSVYDTF